MMHAQPQRGRPKSRARTACPTHEPRCAKDQPSAVYAQRGAHDASIESLRYDLRSLVASGGSQLSVVSAWRVV
jgi:hypothetical protein